MDFTSEVKWNEIKSSHKNLWGCWCFSMNLLSSLFSVKTRFSCFFLFLLLVFSELSVFCFFIIMCYVEPYRLEQMCMFGVTDVDETNICNQCFEDGRKKAKLESRENKNVQDIQNARMNDAIRSNQRSFRYRHRTMASGSSVMIFMVAHFSTYIFCC